MKAIILLGLMMVGLGSFAQEDEGVTAYYQGFKDSGYQFMDENEEIITFNKIDAELVEDFGLKTDEYVGELFYITYKVVKSPSGEILEVTSLEFIYVDEEEDYDE